MRDRCIEEVQVIIAVINIALNKKKRMTWVGKA